jgi:hypothetical protein
VNRGHTNDRHRRPRVLIALAAAISAVLVLPAAPASAEEQVTVASVDVNGQDVQVLRLTVPLSQAGAAAQELAAQTGNPAAIDTPLKLIEASNDTYRSQQWALDQVTFEDAQSLSSGSSVTVAVVDTGVQANHPDLTGQVLTGWNIIKGTTASADDNGHGTHVAGIISAIGNNSAGIAGAAPGVKILPVKVLDASGSGTWADVAAGILWACNNGAKVINLSVGGSLGNQSLADAVTQANASGCLLVAAAGNVGNTTNLPSYPGAYSEPIAVASVDSNLGHSYYSNTGTYVDIAAPGSSIYSTVMGSSYAYMSGTSMATPYAAAEAALIWSANSSWTSTQVRDRLLTTATDLGTKGYDTTFGAGLINPSTALCGHMCLAPAITAVSPTSGSTLGGTSVTVTGTSFNGATAVTFGGSAAASYTVNSATQITATTPAAAASAVNVSVTTTGGSAISTNAFTYVAPAPTPPAPTLTSVTPATGSSLGGSAVTLSGTNFTGATAVSFGGIPATSFTVASPTSITATTPAASAGAVSVSVTTPGGTATSTNAFTYVVPAPTITSVSPASETTAGGSIVTITGTNLTGATVVTFGSAPATAFTVTSATSITATTPAAAAGSVSVSVTTPGGTVTSTNAFTYTVPAPTITSVSPASGTTAGGTTVSIIGTNLTGATAVSFGGTAAASFSVASATSITASTPTSAAGTVYVSVTTAAGTTQLPSAFTFTAPVSGGSSGSSGGGGGGGGGDVVAAPTPATPSVPPAVVAPIVAASSAAIAPATPASAPIRLGGGLTLLQPGDTAAAHPVVVREAASRLSSNAHVAVSKVGQASRFVITGLPRNTVLRVQLAVAGRYALIGRLRTDASGRLWIPVLVSSNAGPHPLKMTTAKGASYYLQIDFRR